MPHAGSTIMGINVLFIQQDSQRQGPPAIKNPAPKELQ